MQVATFITEKIVVDDAGLAYVCANADRFYAVGAALATVVASMVDQPSKRLLKHVIRCYLRMSENPRFILSLKCHRIMFSYFSFRSTNVVCPFPSLFNSGVSLHCRLAFLLSWKMAHSTAVLGWDMHHSYYFVASNSLSPHWSKY